MIWIHTTRFIYVFFSKINDEIVTIWTECTRSCCKSVESLIYSMQHSIHIRMACTITLLAHKNGTVAENNLTHSCAFHSLWEVTFFGTWSWIFSVLGLWLTHRQTLYLLYFRFIVFLWLFRCRWFKTVSDTKKTRKTALAHYMQYKWVNMMEKIHLMDKFFRTHVFPFYTKHNAHVHLHTIKN